MLRRDVSESSVARGTNVVQQRNTPVTSAWPRILNDLMNIWCSRSGPIILWLVLWNINFNQFYMILRVPYIGNSFPNWLSYFWEVLKPSTGPQWCSIVVINGIIFRWSNMTMENGLPSSWWIFASHDFRVGQVGYGNRGHLLWWSTPFSKMVVFHMVHGWITKGYPGVRGWGGKPKPASQGCLFVGNVVLSKCGWPH